MEILIHINFQNGHNRIFFFLSKVINLTGKIL